MNGHVFLWRVGAVTLLIYLQPMFGLVPLVAGSPLLAGLLDLGASWGGVLVGIALMIAVITFAGGTTGTAVLIRPAGVTTVFCFWGLPVRLRRLSLTCRIQGDGGFDFDEVVLHDEQTEVRIETPLGAEGPLLEELRRAQHRAVVARVSGAVPLKGGPRPIHRHL
jgi:hypothetical protein